MCDYIDKLVIDCVLNKHRIPYAQDLEILRVRGKHNAVPPCEDGSTRRSITCHISEAKPLHEGEFTCVYRATMSAEGFNPVDVVIKTDMYADTPRPTTFVHEMEVYERDLVSLQAYSIPRCFGLYQARIEDEDEVQTASFLLLKYSGTPVDHHNAYPPEFMDDVLQKLVALHGRGFEHGDFDDRNILMDENGKAKFIDLEEVTPHKCGLNRTLFFGDLQPTTVGCKEIDLASRLWGVWQSPYIKFHNIELSIHNIQPGTAQDIVRRMNHWGGPGIEDDQALEDAESLIEWVETWREWYHSITAEDRYFEFTAKPIKTPALPRDASPKPAKPEPEPVKPLPAPAGENNSDDPVSESGLSSCETGSTSVAHGVCSRTIDDA